MSEAKTDRRDRLMEIEGAVQKQWEENKTFEVDAGKNSPDKKKFMVTFPYPYMNGVLHVGHAFTLSKCEFTSRFQRLLGKRTLFPFGFHCTGMPIAACADKLKVEFDLYGDKEDLTKPLVFPQEEEAKEDAPKASGGGKKKKKGKIAKKKSKHKYQWQIMQEMGVPTEEIHKFRDATYWLGYFPPIARDDLKYFGLSADFRRAFITTEVNPYYDSFIQWQFRRLRQAEKVKFGTRMSVFSPTENQVCADHDRASGEGVGVQEYTLIKLQLTEQPEGLKKVLEEAKVSSDAKIYMPAATLRPETMYGQTNCFVLPTGKYAVCGMRDGDVWIMSEHSARNLSYQGDYFENVGQPNVFGTVKGEEFVGLKAVAPLCPYESVYILPLVTIKMNVGTGVVTSVPSDAPADYAALMDAIGNQKYQKKHGISAELAKDLAENYPVIPIIDTPIPDANDEQKTVTSAQAAVDLCKRMKVKGSSDTGKLNKIKDLVYLRSFYHGVMTAEACPWKGERVNVVKEKVKALLIEKGLGDVYSEPESEVVSRSGTVCVAALTDQWYLDYGEEKWRSIVSDHVSNTLETFSPAAKKKFEYVVGWLEEWACSREYGLGTKIPFEPSEEEKKNTKGVIHKIKGKTQSSASPEYVIESLSDSTIYWAYYTVAFLLQNGVLNGSEAGPAQIQPEQMTDDVWNYIFLPNQSFPQECKIPKETLDQMRNEFLYWYPVDLRASGKDLIGNHLTMSIYNHAAIWPDQPEMLPRGFYTNGHLMINKKKMSKSTGNFMTLRQAINKYGADATRFALAEAGDSLDDANFSELMANKIILTMTKFLEWFPEVLKSDQLRGSADLPEDIITGKATDSNTEGESKENLTFFDKVFLNEMRLNVVKARRGYERMQFHRAASSGFYAMLNARDQYRLNEQSGMHRGLLRLWGNWMAVMVSPIVPHFAQHVYADILGNKGFVVDAQWPLLDQWGSDGDGVVVDEQLNSEITFIREQGRALRRAKDNEIQRAVKSKKPAPELKECVIHVASGYLPWQKDVISMIQKDPDCDARQCSKFVNQTLKKAGKRKKAAAMKFVIDALSRRDELSDQASMDEEALLNQYMKLVSHESGLDSVTVSVCDVESEWNHNAKVPVPGVPSFTFT